MKNVMELFVVTVVFCKFLIPALFFHFLRYS